MGARGVFHPNDVFSTMDTKRGFDFAHGDTKLHAPTAITMRIYNFELGSLA